LLFLSENGHHFCSATAEKQSPHKDNSKLSNTTPAWVATYVLAWLKMYVRIVGLVPGDNPTTVIYNAMSSLVRVLRTKIFSSTFKKPST
jgi:hypothetical protein